MNQLILLHAAYLRGRGYSKRTVEAAMQCLDRIDRHVRLGIARTSRTELEAYFGNPKWAPQTREVYFFHAAKFYAWATDDDIDLLDANPMERMQKPKKARRGSPRPLADREVEVILAAAADPFRLCAVIALEAGLRCCEIANLRKEDVTDEGVYILQGKGGGSDTVPGRTPLLLQLIDDYPAGNLVVHAGGRPEAQWISTRAAVPFQQRLGLAGVTMHRLRHTYGKRLRDAGCDAFVIKRKMRHSSLTSTEIYVGASDEECRQAVRGLAPLPYKIPVAC